MCHGYIIGPPRKVGWMRGRGRNGLKNQELLEGFQLENSVFFLFVDNYSSNASDYKVNVQLKNINTKIFNLPANATDLVQPTDSFVIQKIKEVWQIGVGTITI